MEGREASKSILKGIDYLIKKRMENYSIDKTFTGIIKSKDNNLYGVMIQGKTYNNVPSMFNSLDINDTVKIKIPQGRYSQMYIEGKYNMPDYKNEITEIKNKILLLEQEIEQLKGGTN